MTDEPPNFTPATFAIHQASLKLLEAAEALDPSNPNGRRERYEAYDAAVHAFRRAIEQYAQQKD